MSGIIIRMTSSFKRSVQLLVLLLLPTIAGAVELTGRFSVLGNGAWSDTGDLGYTTSGSKPLMVDQQSLRLMLDDAWQGGEWSLHAKAVRQNFVRYPPSYLHSSDLFRSDKLSGNWQDRQGNNHAVRSGYDIDRAMFKLRSDKVTFAAGRQPVDWGSGRLWQPLNVFGAFAPTDLDTDYKPGIDAAVGEWFPSSFSSLSVAFVPALNRTLVTAASGAAYLRSQVGEVSETGLLGGRILGENVAGASFESDIAGIGWRIEGLYTTAKHGSLFWIAGLNYQFEDGTAVVLEWYENSGGAVRESQLGAAANDRLVQYGLQQYLGRHLLGIAVTRDITPLLNGSYTLLASGLADRANQLSCSLLHQASLIYSVSNESDILFSVLLATGKGLNASGSPQSEFGHVPASVAVRYRLYF